MTSQEMRDRGYFDLFGDIYRLCQSNTNDWEGIVANANSICGKYQGGPLGKLSNDLIMSVVSELERISN